MLANGMVEIEKPLYLYSSPIIIKVIDKEEIQLYLKYAIEKYGKDFTKLYQGK
jgi:hypothetical protein